MRARPLVEICCDTLTSALAAAAGGADRIELCGPLDAGGTTPSFGLIDAVCREVSIPVHVLVRPRSGDFSYSPGELRVMALDARYAQKLGASGVVTGALTSTGMVDRPAMQTLIAAADPLRITFHRAIDVVPDPLAALDELVELGIERVLTSGGRPTAIAGAVTIAQLVERARGRIVILAGSGVSAANAAQLARDTGVRELHVGSAVRRPVRQNDNAACAGQFGTAPAEVAEELVAELIRNLA
ncbi:MAG: copper homeostasis protein CutC [Pirellulales bacterium]